MSRRPSPTTLGAALAALLLAGCGQAVDDTASPAAGSPSTSPTSRPTLDAPPRWPARFPHPDYRFVLRRDCFCADGGVPVLVTVRDGKAVSAVYARAGQGHAAGDPAGEWNLVSLDQVIAATRKHAYRTEVRWPEGQEYPDRVSVDVDKRMVDEEFGYRVSRVEVGLQEG